MKSSVVGHRGAMLHVLGDPDVVGIENSYQYFADGLLVIEDGLIKDLGDAASLLSKISRFRGRHS